MLVRCADADKLEAESEALSRTADAMGDSVAAIAALEGDLRMMTQQRDDAQRALVRCFFWCCCEKCESMSSREGHTPLHSVGRRRRNSALILVHDVAARNHHRSRRSDSWPR